MGTSVRELRAVVAGEVAVGAAGLDRRHQHLAVSDPFAHLLPEGGLVRGRSVACTGGAAVSVALALAAEATQRGSWLAVVGLPWMGVDAARERGVALERMVRIDVPADVPADVPTDVPTDMGPPVVSDWAERAAAAADGFELVLTRVPARVSERMLRQVRQRFQARGGVLIDVRPGGRPPRSSSAGADLVVDAAVDTWTGIDRGSGHLRDRVVELTVTGRRSPRPRRVRWSPSMSGSPVFDD